MSLKSNAFFDESLIKLSTEVNWSCATADRLDISHYYAKIFIDKSLYMSVIILIYILLLIVFLVVSSLILRHTVKFGYLSPRFKTVAIIFGILALFVIILSIYLMSQIGRPSSGEYEYYNNNAESVSTGDLNF